MAPQAAGSGGGSWAMWCSVHAWTAEVGTPRSRMTRDESRYVYKQETCRRCGTAIRRWDLAGRWAYACESCQPPS